MFLPKLNGNSVANTTSLLDAILKKLPGDPLLREFAEQFLQGASARMLEVLGTAALQSLVQGRFAFFWPRHTPPEAEAGAGDRLQAG